MYNVMDSLRGCRQLNSTPVITCYHPFALLVSICVLLVCLLKNEHVTSIEILDYSWQTKTTDGNNRGTNDDHDRTRFGKIRLQMSIIELHAIIDDF